jgi:hypothetical protein
MPKSILPFEPKPKDKPTKFEKWSSISAIVATIISAFALVISVIVMLDTKNQNQTNLDLTIKQFEFAKEQKHEDSLKHSQLSIREDSLNNLRDSLSKYQISLYKTQDEIMQNQLDYQNKIYENEIYTTRPKISISILEVQPSNNMFDTIFFEMHNKGQREAQDVSVKIFYVNVKTEKYFIGPELKSSLILPNDIHHFFTQLEHEFIENSLDQNDFYIELKYHLLDPITHKTTETTKFGRIVYENNDYKFTTPSNKMGEKIKSIVSGKVFKGDFNFYEEDN